MKHIFTFILSMIILSSCGEKIIYVDKESGLPVYETGTVLVNGQLSPSHFYLRIDEITINGETHEYLHYQTYCYPAYTHWAGCKYCKHNEQD